MGADAPASPRPEPTDLRPITTYAPSQVWSSTATLTLVSHEEMGRSTMLIKDWKDQFLDLGDKQSLLASLRESPFYRAFEDVGARAASRGPRVFFRVRDREGGRGGQGEMLGPRGSEFFSVCRGCVWQRGSTICTGHLATWAYTDKACSVLTQIRPALSSCV